MEIRQRPDNQYTTSEPIAETIFREYKWNGPWDTIDCPYTKWQRVTDPNATNQGAKKYLPNKVNTIQLYDLDRAIDAEVCIEQWGGHVGTSDKKMSINGKEWITIPESPYIGHGSPPECYQYFKYPTVKIPIDILKEGLNTFEFSCGKQICNDFGWGQWGFYGIIFRVYYSKEKEHPTGIVNFLKEKENPNNLVLTVEEVTSTTPIERIDFIGFYEDFDYNGDGIYKEWHYTFRYCEIKNHIGSIFSEPYKLSWNISWIPIQVQDVKLLARITDYEGITYITPIKSIPAEYFSTKVKIYKSSDMPIGWQSRDGNIFSCNFNIEEDINSDILKKAIIFLSTWNGLECDKIEINRQTILNRIGRNHDYSCDEINMPITLLKTGVNTFSTSSYTKGHGIEVLWPGITVKIKYF